MNAKMARFLGHYVSCTISLLDDRQLGAELLIMSRDIGDKLCMQFLSSFKPFIAVMDCNPSMEHSTLLAKLGIKVNKVKRQLTKQLRKVERCELPLHANSEYDGAGNTIPICDQMEWIPIVYKHPCQVETYTICFWRTSRLQNGPVCSCSKDAVVQTDLSLTVDGHVWARVTLLSSCAIPPTMDEEHTQEIHLYSPRGYNLASNVGQGIKTDLLIELPPGVYGNITGHPDSPLVGVMRLESAVIMLSSKENIQLFVYNSSGQRCEIKRGDLLASVFLLQNFIPILDIQPYNRRECVTT